MSALPPKSGHRLSLSRCPLCANSGHWPVLFDHFVGRLCSLPLAGGGGTKIARRSLALWVRANFV